MINFIRAIAPIALLSASLLIAACEPIETSTSNPRQYSTDSIQNTSANNTELALSATRIANGFNAFGNDASNGIRLVGARSEGETVIVESEIIKTRIRVERSRARGQLQALVCQNATFRTFVEAGGTMQFVYSNVSNNKGGRDVVVTISSCRR